MSPPDRRRLDELVAAVAPARAADPERVGAHLNDLTKPPGSLGRLEELALRLALIYGDPPPRLRPATVFVLAADHGVARKGVSAYPSEVTAQMTRNLARGGAAINAVAGAVDARVVVADFGVDADLSEEDGVEARKVRPGTGDLSSEPAMSTEECVEAIMEGARMVRDRAVDSPVVALGEMGIGNTTAASAVTGALLRLEASKVIGPGTGVGSEGLARKRAAVEAGLAMLAGETDSLKVLARVGGLEMAGLTGVVLGAGSLGKAVVTDGFIATAAALAAVRLCPTARDYLFPSHLSAEPGHRRQLEALELEPLLDLQLRLGEGTGAALALPILDSAGSILREMATFGRAGVSGPTENGKNSVEERET